MRKWDRNSGCPTHNFAVVVVQHPVTKLFLAVDETKNRGWWLPAGFVEPGDDLIATAHKETLEEAGIEIKLKGILRIEHSISQVYGRMRAVFFANPKEPNQPLKTIPDQESNGAKWVSLEKLNKMNLRGKLRGPELLLWAHYILKGGFIYPLSVLGQESKLPSTNLLLCRQLEYLQVVFLDHLLANNIEGMKSVISFGYSATNSFENATQAPTKTLNRPGNPDKKKEEEESEAELLLAPAIAKNLFINCATNESRSTPLIVACRKRNLSAARFLLENGADIHASLTSGKQALHVALRSKHASLDVIELLLEYNANILTRDRKGRTPLHLATKKEVFDLIKNKLPEDFQIASSMKDKSGNTPHI